MVHFTSTIKRYGDQGEKTGWRFIEVPAEIAEQLLPGNKKSFRVKGSLDVYIFERTALIPIGGGDFIMPINGETRKKIRKSVGAEIEVKMKVDDSPIPICADLMDCLADDPDALDYFNKLPGSHQKYYSKWIESAKTDETRAKRIALTLTACSRKQRYNDLMRSLKSEKENFLR